jgi:hypothetical protein
MQQLHGVLSAVMHVPADTPIQCWCQHHTHSPALMSAWNALTSGARWFCQDFVGAAWLAGHADQQQQQFDVCQLAR